MPEDASKRIRANFARQLFMKTLGAELVSVTPGSVEIGFTFRSELTQQHGFIHAGGITSVLDSASGYAALSVAPEGTDVLTIEFKVNLLAPAVGDRFLARAHVKRAGRNVTVCAADAFAVRGVEEKLIATMLATIMTVNR